LDSIGFQAMSEPDTTKMKLVSEIRWHRQYAMEEPNQFLLKSKFARI
jgi:hypothetical protein